MRRYMWQRQTSCRLTCCTKRRLRGNMNISTTRPNESLSFGDIVTMITPRLKIEWEWRSLSHRLGDRRREKKWNYHLTMDRQQRKEEIQFLQLSCSLFFIVHTDRCQAVEIANIKWNHTYAREGIKEERKMRNLKSSLYHVCAACSMRKI